MPAEQPADTLAGQVVGGRYRLIRRIGKGGMGIVYEAEHQGLDKRVAVKFLLDRYTDDPEVIERFHREARTASRIGQGNIIDVTDVGRSDDGRPFLVMELLEGKDLAGVLVESGPMPAARAVHLVRQILRGLEAAHGKGIVHRDMKPENVFVVPHDDDPDFVKIMDFGISKVIAANDSKVRLTATGAVIGTPVYMAPEQALAQTEVDHRVDLYAVGVMLFELLAGRPPFLSTSYLGLVTQHLNTPPPSLAQFRPDLPPTLVALVARALEKDPARRWASAAEMSRALPPSRTLRELDVAETLGDSGGVRVATGGGVAAGPALLPTPLPMRAAATTERRRTVVWIAGAAVVVAGVVVAIAILSGNGERGRDGARAATPAAVADAAAPAAVASSVAKSEPQVVSLGKVDVRATPNGAKVYLDGEYKGPSPVLIESVTGGAHELRLEKDGYQTLSTSVLVSSEQAAVVDDALVAVGGAPVPTATTSAAIVHSTSPPGRATKPTHAGASSGTADTGAGSAGAGAGSTSSGSGSGSGSSTNSRTTRPGEKPNPYD